jgi:glycine oxidase
VRDFAIIGGGLAGTTIAWRLWEAGASFVLVDARDLGSSSRVAAGLLTPITGQRPTLSWRWDELSEVAFQFYRDVESQSQMRFFYPRPMVRVFDSIKERKEFESRFPEIAICEKLLATDTFETPFGAAEVPGAARLDVRAYLDASHRFFEQHDAMMYHRVEIDELIHSKLNVRHVIFCQGYQQNALFHMVRFAASQGEILTLRIPENVEHRTINRMGKWLTHIRDDIYRAGSTYDRSRLDGLPTQAGRDAILSALSRTLRLPVEVVDHQAGVRPIIHVSKPIVAVHPTNPCWSFFNGLGSKGSVSAPFFSQQLVDHLLHGSSLEEQLGWSSIPRERVS